MATNPKSIEGIYKHGKVELLETPKDVDEARVILTFVTEGSVDLAERGIDECYAANLRARLATFTDDWGDLRWERTMLYRRGISIGAKPAIFDSHPHYCPCGFASRKSFIIGTIMDMRFIKVTCVVPGKIASLEGGRGCMAPWILPPP